MGTLQRIKEYIDHKGITNQNFEKSVGFSNGAFSSQLKNNRTIGVDKLENIISTYTDLDPTWLLTGKGKMLRDDTGLGIMIKDSTVGEVNRDQDLRNSSKTVYVGVQSKNRDEVEGTDLKVKLDEAIKKIESQQETIIKLSNELHECKDKIIKLLEH